MPSEPHNLDDALKALATGDVDALSPEQVERLEGLLNSRPELADAFARQLAVPDEPLRAALTSAATPSANQWERAWNGIASAEGSAARARGRGRIWRLWAPLSAVAASLLLVGVWRATAPAPAPAPWPMQLASDVEIDELEVYGDATAFVVYTGGDEGIDVIWVLEGEG
jgi:hypothetical protein